ncbi:MAG: GvpL/GvpF family gas vesicle protein, partial [Dehalococcoidia bacterium]|nr:GvpL/GvpF family gas vesicle protein [Dehalococcoidia bacterium]
MAGKYIYGIINSGDEGTLATIGLGGSRPAYTIAHQDIACVLSDYAGREVVSMSREEVVRSLLAHQTVLEYMMREHTILPIKFGTVLATHDEVRDFLSAAHKQFADALAWIEGKVEVEVAATWDTAQVLREIGVEPEIVRAREAIARRPGEGTVEATLEERIRLGQMAKAAMDRRRDSYRERMIDFLKPVAIDVQPNALISDQMVMNVAFLVEKARQDEFDARVRQLNELFHEQIDFRIIGPLPPYSFATVEVTRPSPEKIEKARQVLGLGAVISEAEVRRAYRRLAAQAHPDRKPGDGRAKMEFTKLRQASDLLIACCRGQAGSGGSFLTNIRRLTDDEVQHLRFAEGGVVAGGA